MTSSSGWKELPREPEPTWDWLRERCESLESLGDLDKWIEEELADLESENSHMITPKSLIRGIRKERD